MDKNRARQRDEQIPTSMLQDTQTKNATNRASSTPSALGDELENKVEAADLAVEE